MGGVITNSLVERAKSIPKAKVERKKEGSNKSESESVSELQDVNVVEVRADFDSVEDAQTKSGKKAKKPKKKKKKKPVLARAESESDEADVGDDTDVRGPGQASAEKPLIPAETEQDVSGGIDWDKLN